MIQKREMQSAWGEGSGGGMREEASPPTLGWHDLVNHSAEIYHWEGTWQGQGKDTHSRDALVHLNTKESDLRQGFSNLIVHTNYWLVGEVLLKSRFWYSRSRIGLRSCISNKLLSDSNAASQILWAVGSKKPCHSQMLMTCYKALSSVTNTAPCLPNIFSFYFTLKVPVLFGRLICSANCLVPQYSL